MIAKDLIKKIRKIEIRTHRLVNHRLAGQYHSAFKGSGMAFSEVRQYQPGDDIRMIDWNVSARMRDVFVKLFTEERELTVMLMIDMSASTLFGSGEQTKREVAAEIAATLAFSAIKNNDRVGAIIFSDRVEKFIPPKKGRKHVLRLITEILHYQPQSRKTNLSAGLNYLGRVAKRRAVVILLSDFLEDDPDPERLKRALKIVARRHDLVPVTIRDPLEDRLPPMGIVTMEDLETGTFITFDSFGKEAKQYADKMTAQRTAREDLFVKLKLDALRITVGKEYVSALVNFFHARQRRLRH